MLLVFLLFFLILSFLILSHEFGHFILAKISGVKVEEFGLGLPPRIFGLYKENGKINFLLGSTEIKTESTIYSINLIPFGGFNKIYGEEVKEEKELKDPKSFASKSLFERALIVLGGIIFGILLAVIIFYFILGLNGFVAEQGLIFNYKFPFGSQKNFPMIVEVFPNTPAEKGELLPYDLILKVDGKELKNSEELVEIIKKSGGKELLLEVKNLRKKEIREITVLPEVKSPQLGAQIGIGLRQIAEIKYQKSIEKIFVGFFHSANLIHYTFFALYNLFKISIFTRSISPLASQTAGIVGIFALTKLTIEEIGLIELFNLLALLSLGLAIANFLPLPALDGGRLIFLGYEAIFKKRISPIIERKINTAGLVALLILYFLITYKDIWQYKDILFK